MSDEFYNQVKEALISIPDRQAARKIVRDLGLGSITEMRNDVDRLRKTYCLIAERFPDTPLPAGTWDPTPYIDSLRVSKILPVTAGSLVWGAINASPIDQRRSEVDVAWLEEQAREGRAGFMFATTTRTAPDILHAAAQHLIDRAAARDQESERSMARCVKAYAAITGHELSERDGWMFMVVLKATRACSTSAGLRDDYEDLAAYGALAGESAQC